MLRASIINKFAVSVVALAVLAVSCGSDEPEPAAVEPPATTAAAPPTSASPDNTDSEPAAPSEPAETADNDTPPPAEDVPSASDEPAVSDEPSDTDPDPEVAEPEEVVVWTPSLVVDPTEVPEGLTTFTIAGSGFDPTLVTLLLVCTPPGGELSPDSDSAAIEAALYSLTPEDCNSDPVEAMDVAEDGSFFAVRTTEASDDFAWVASDPDRTSAAMAMVFTEAPEPEAEPEPTTTVPLAATTTVPEPAPTTTTTTTTVPEPAPTTTTTTTTVPEPAPTTTTTTTTVPEPAPTTTTVPETEPEPEPAPTTTTLPPVEVVVEPISAPLDRCAAPGWYGASLLSVFVGNFENGYYEPVVTPADRPHSCERIKAAWDAIRLAEAERIAEGQYPCEYPAAYNLFPLDEVRTNGPAMYVGCWPRLFTVGAVEDWLDDPEAEAYRLWYWEGTHIEPPNHPVMVEALYDCYRDALMGPPPGWTSPTGGHWVHIAKCNEFLTRLGNPVRYLGVTPQCIAALYSKRIADWKAPGTVGSLGWADNCETSASRLLPEDLDTYSEKCEAVIDAAAGPQTDLLAEAGGGTRDDVIAAVKAMFCPGTDQAIWDNADTFQKFMPHWSWPDGLSYGQFAVNWLPPEGASCHEAAMLVAAERAVNGGGWIRVHFC